MKPISQFLEIHSQNRGNKKNTLLFPQYVKNQLVLIMKPPVVTNVINGSISDAISVKKLTEVSKKIQHHGIVSFVSVLNFYSLNKQH